MCWARKCNSILAVLSTTSLGSRSSNGFWSDGARVLHEQGARYFRRAWRQAAVFLGPRAHVELGLTGKEVIPC